MDGINFCKFHGFGNDYIIFESEELKNISSIGDFAKQVCHRNIGIGGDGIAVLEKSENEAADFSCRIINPDGSEAGFSGNGTRCAVAYLYFKNLWQEKSLKLQTRSGIKTYELLERNDLTFWFRAELGKPDFNLPRTPLSEAFFESSDVAQNSKEFCLMMPDEAVIINCTFVDVGNPVAVIFLEDFNQINWRHFGSKIENFTEIFPERTNVVFVKIIDKENIEIRIWERGAGETASSGTCSIAAAVAGAFTGKTERKVSVHAQGGTTKTIWREDDEMLITGRADLVFCGEWFENA